MSLLTRSLSRISSALVTLVVTLTCFASAQNADFLVYTVGKTFTVGGETWAYVLWQPGNASTTLGRKFAVYRKDGIAAAATPYTKLGVQGLQSSPSATKALLILGGQFDPAAEVVPGRINALYADATNQPNEVLDPPPTVPDNQIATQFGQLLQLATDDPKVLDRLMFLGRAHPGVMMCLGHGFAIKVANDSLHTYEVREVDAGGNDLQVVGRATLNAAAPLILPSPGRPFAVLHETPGAAAQVVASPMDHLACRFRWSVPVNLRRLIPHTFGFNLYRVKESVAINLGWDLVAPEIGELTALVEAGNGPDPDAKLVNSLPVLPTALLTDAEAANATEHDTFFLHDDNDPPDNRFSDGQTFYYFAAARDIAGYPGSASKGTRITYCDRLPPPVPAIESIRNIFTSPLTKAQLDDLEGTQHFRLRIRQLPEQPVRDAATRYYIYRWTYAQQWISDGGDPNNQLVGSVPHVPGQAYIDWNHTGAGAPMIKPGNNSWFNKTVWFTVRAEDASACSPKNLSGHSPPKFGVLRDRVGPGRPSGTLQRCRATVITENSRTRQELKRKIGLAGKANGFVVEVTRHDKLVQSFDIRVNKGIDTAFKTTRYYATSDVQQIYIPLPDSQNFQIMVRGRSQIGQVGAWASMTAGAPIETDDYINIYAFDCTVEARYTPISGIPEHPPEHEVDGPNGIIIGPNGTITTPPTSREWRVYRKVGAKGEYQLIARGNGSPIPANIPWADEAPPTTNGTEVCYFGQVFDEHGNSGPLTRIGCVKMVTGNLPIPMLSPLELLAADGEQAQIKLKWFCDPAGVERFEIWAAADGAPEPGITGAKISPILGSADGLVISDEANGIAFSAHQSPTVSGGFGSGAEFELTLFVPANKLLYFAVRAVGSGKFDSRSSGSFSNLVSEIWQQPAAPDQAVVPWPDRPLPIVNELNFEVDDYLVGEGPFYAQAMSPGLSGSATILVGMFSSATQPDSPATAFFSLDSPPTEAFFKFRKQSVPDLPDVDQLESILPFVVYRHQVPNTTFPLVVPNLVQVSPLIDRISYRTGQSFYEVSDPFFLYPTLNLNPIGSHIPTSGTFQRESEKLKTGLWESTLTRPPYAANDDGLMLWVDHMPAIKGATYQYLLVHFTERGEIDRVIPTNTVTHLIPQ